MGGSSQPPPTGNASMSNPLVTALSNPTQTTAQTQPTSMGMATAPTSALGNLVTSAQPSTSGNPLASSGFPDPMNAMPQVNGVSSSMLSPATGSTSGQQPGSLQNMISMYLMGNQPGGQANA